MNFPDVFSVVNSPSDVHETSWGHPENISLEPLQNSSKPEVLNDLHPLQAWRTVDQSPDSAAIELDPYRRDLRLASQYSMVRPVKTCSMRTEQGRLAAPRSCLVNTHVRRS
ncbi:hypothetical protein RRG08_055625 [Elysia crispata]|uniref:Uncharacterized protein n=1 Tax=Elysia crispata TaxID=231223 RepID=A0AAE1DC27_9GAST|nr:hypothetical protein RRG08_055625 [Elysia crispata]